MKKIIFGFLLLCSPLVMADCSTDQTVCETKCAVVHFSDEAAELGCKSKCVAKRAVCSTESGAKTVVETGGDVIDSGVEVSKEAWKDTKSFVKGLTE
ncbi:hypothetical protein [Neptuniibacter caesariensis]|uniref:Uncharacterized protein n=1 Tax=Neptuniibacter caesariensis TaxID=207954 RepID=A0A7U8C731_NEPCE|nr:hypothetical protein [Neptuniibacter caesariensis]EAR61086.1 hypothetical protein MED92_01714 [Neptuniibacter caesariensis]